MYYKYNIIANYDKDKVIGDLCLKSDKWNYYFVGE